MADIGNKSEPQLDLGNGDPYELLKKRGIPTTLSDEERVAADAYGLVAKNRYMAIVKIAQRYNMVMKYMKKKQEML